MDNNIDSFVHQRHKPTSDGPGASQLTLACPPMRSNVNLARIVRAASCSGVRKIVVCGQARIDPKIARDGIEQIKIERRRSLEPILKQWKKDGIPLVGLEQTTNSRSLFDFCFPVQSVLVVGHERDGLNDSVLDLLDFVVEIPVYGLPYSHNVATATTMALYEYCRQHGQGPLPS